ncbi:MAG: sodium:proton antiporter [Bacteroidota bacterium]
MTPIFSVSVIGMLCILCQWLGWRYKIPAIVLLSVTGLLLGPVSGLLNPQLVFGSNLRTIISMAVAIILFDGGLGLRFKELKDMKRTVWQMVFIGAPLGWMLTAAACHYVAGLSWPVSLIFGGILVVTGPTVILPLLRQARLHSRTSAVLKWEGIVNDPLGALFAVVAYEYFASPSMQHSPVFGFSYLALRIGGIVLFAYLTGRAIRWIFHRGHVPEFLKQPTVLIVVLLVYALANLWQDEGGLIAVTVLGMTLANSDLRNLDEMRRFKEYLSLLLVSLVFILITATLRWQDLGLLDWRTGAFIAMLLLVIRPLTVLCSTVRSGLTRQELLFIGWIAPRGIVCAAVCGLLGPQIVSLGYADGAKMVPLAFTIIFATVIGHGFTMRPWGRRLGLVYDNISGLLIVGCNPFTVELARRLRELDVPVLITDTDWHELRLARQGQVPLHYGEILSEDAEFKLELSKYGELLAATGNEAYNALLATHFAHSFGHEHIVRLAIKEAAVNAEKISTATLRIPTLLESIGQETVMQRIKEGWKIKAIRISTDYPLSLYQTEQGTQSIPLMSVTALRLIMHTSEGALPSESGYTLVVFAPPNSYHAKPVTS